MLYEGDSLKVIKGDPSLDGEDLWLFSNKYRVNVLPLKAVRAKLKYELLVSHFTFPVSHYL